MEQDNITKRKHDEGRFWGGVLIIAFGILLLLYKMNFPIPGWIFSWKMILIAIGLFIGFKSKFQNHGWVVLVIIGSLFLVDDVFYNMSLHDYIFPIILIGVGAMFILRPKRKDRIEKLKEYPGYTSTPAYEQKENYDDTLFGSSGNASEEFLEINAALGGAKRIILSKNFKGGEINCFMGGAELNMLQADIQHPVKLEANIVFGGMKIMIPSNWELRFDSTNIFGGVDDKRNITHVITDPNKILTIEGTVVFGGIEVRNF